MDGLLSCSELGIGDWGMGSGDWGLETGDWGNMKDRFPPDAVILSVAKNLGTRR